MCDCMETIEQRLADAHANTKICRTITLGDSLDAFPTIQTEKADKAVRKKPMAVIPTFCPWCGLHYKTGQPAALKAQQEVRNG